VSHQVIHITSLCFSGAFAKLRKATISFVMYVCPSVHLSVHKVHLYSHWTEFHNKVNRWGILGFRREQMRSALFWDITQRVVVNPYRRFGKTYRANFQSSRNPFMTLEDGQDGTDRFSRNLGKLLPLCSKVKQSRYRPEGAQRCSGS